MKNAVKVIRYALFLAIPVVVVSCYPGGAEYYSDTDIVMTDYNDTFDFSAAQTYYMVDSIEYVGDNDEDVDHTYDELILSTVAGKMNDMGYQRIDYEEGQDPPDLLLQISVSTSSNEGVGWVPGYPGYPWYPGYPGWGWDWWWGYPGYPGGYYPYYYSFKTGTLAITLGDVDGIHEDDKGDTVIPAVWMATINGLLSSSTTDIKNRITRNINQAFKQSPYLEKK